jgi:hypothetical protein
MPVLAEVGIEPGEPEVLEVRNMALTGTPSKPPGCGTSAVP